jgi:hypothetical protein
MHMGSAYMAAPYGFPSMLSMPMDPSIAEHYSPSRRMNSSTGGNMEIRSPGHATPRTSNKPPPSPSQQQQGKQQYPGVSSPAERSDARRGRVTAQGSNNRQGGAKQGQDGVWDKFLASI